MWRYFGEIRKGTPHYPQFQTQWQHCLSILRLRGACGTKLVGQCRVNVNDDLWCFKKQRGTCKKMRAGGHLVGIYKTYKLLKRNLTGVKGFQIGIIHAEPYITLCRSTFRWLWRPWKTISNTPKLSFYLVLTPSYNYFRFRGLLEYLIVITIPLLHMINFSWTKWTKFGNCFDWQMTAGHTCVCVLVPSARMFWDQNIEN